MSATTINLPPFPSVTVDNGDGSTSNVPGINPDLMAFAEEQWAQAHARWRENVEFENWQVRVGDVFGNASKFVRTVNQNTGVI